MKNNIKLSVIIISYKQKKYIKECIDSVLMQKVDFKYELLLADDCSNDGTLEIMKEYEKKYPNIIKVLERKKNLGGNNNSLDALLNTKGEYVTCLEGDDYWCNENKLQIQIDFLDSHPDYIGISHLQEGRNLKNEIQGYFPKTARVNFTIDGVNDYIKNNKVFSMSSTMYRNYIKDDILRERSQQLKKLDTVIGDAQTNVFLCDLGKIYVLKDAMMVYRMRNNDGNSNFNSVHRINEIEYRYMNIYIKMEEIYDYKYSFYKKIKNNYTLGVAYDICKFKFKDIKRFNKVCPKKYKLRIYFSFPFTCITILYKRFIKR